MVNPFLTNDALEKFVRGLNISQKNKSFLLSKIPQLDKEERRSLFNLLTQLYFLNLEKERAIERLKKFWQK